MDGTEAGWYEDPSDPSQFRYWDGESWTGLRSSRPTGEPGNGTDTGWSAESPRGWYPDPDGSEDYRFWTGRSWTDSTARPPDDPGAASSPTNAAAANTAGESGSTARRPPSDRPIGFDRPPSRTGRQGRGADLAPLKRELETAAMVYELAGRDVPELVARQDIALDDTELVVSELVSAALSAGHETEVQDLLRAAADHPVVSIESRPAWLDFLERMSVEPDDIIDHDSGLIDDRSVDPTDDGSIPAKGSEPVRSDVMTVLNREIEAAAAVYAAAGDDADASPREVALDETEVAVATARIDAYLAGHEDDVQHLLIAAREHAAISEETRSGWLKFLERMSVEPESADRATDPPEPLGSGLGDLLLSDNPGRSLLGRGALVALAFLLLWGFQRLLLGDGSTEVGKCYNQIKAQLNIFDEVPCDHPRAIQLLAVGADVDNPRACPNSPLTLVLVGDDDQYCFRIVPVQFGS